MRHLPALALALLLAACSDSPSGDGGQPDPGGEARRYSLTVSVEGKGQLVSAPSGIACGSDCGESYADGAVVSLTASPEAGQSFLGWGGACAGSNPLCTLVLHADTTVSARFSSNSAQNLKVSREGQGTVSSDLPGIDCGAHCEAGFATDSSLNLSAEAAAGWQFAGWSGDCSGSAECRLSMSAARDVGARFTALPAAAPLGAWLAGDMHVHTDHSADGSLPRQLLDGRGAGNVSVSDQIGQGALSGLDWMPITDHRTYDQHYDPLWTSDQLLLIPGEEANGSPHANPIGAVDWVVQGANYPGRPGWAVLQTSIWDAHSQGAVWSHNHPDDGHLNDDGTPNERANALGADVMEIWNRASGIEAELKYAEGLWNAGYRFSGVGGSDNHFRELWLLAGPGQPATHAFAGEASERSILQGLQAGRVHLNGGNNGLFPTLSLEADLDGDGVYEAMAGDERVAVPGSSGKLRLRIQNAIGSTVTLYRNPGKSAGAVVASYTPFQLEQIHEIDIQAGDSQSWYYAEARGLGFDSLNTNDIASIFNPVRLVDARQAITAPIFIGPSLASPQPAEAIPAEVASEDGARRLFGSLGRFAGFPDLASSEGLRHLVAEVHEEGSTKVMYRHIAADGRASPPLNLAPDSRSARFPRVAALGAEVWVVWQDERAGQVPRRPAVYLRHSSDGGLSWQPEQVVRAIAGRAERPVVALRPDGKPVVAWQEIRAAEPMDVFAQVLGLDAEPVNVSRVGKSFQAANIFDSRSAIYPASVWPTLAVRADGRIALAYHDDRSDPDPLWTGQTLSGDSSDVDNWQIRVHTRAVDGDWSEAASLGADDRADRHAALAYASDGSLICVWDSKTLDAAGANLSIRHARSTDDGASFLTAETLLGGAEQAFSQYPRLGIDADGRVRAVWTDNRSADWRWKTMTAVFDPAQGWSAGTLLTGPGNNTWAATAGGELLFASSRHAQRLQRDPTQQVFLRRLP